jgi:hypothetical protein
MESYRTMTTAVEALLKTFDAPSDAERREAAAEIIRRMTLADDELPEGVLLEAADAFFLQARHGASGECRPLAAARSGLRIAPTSRPSHEPSSGYGESQ